MPVDDRIRAGLSANAAAFEPAVESSLDNVRGRGRRRRAVQVAVGAGLVAAACVAPIAIVGLRAPDRPPPTAGVPAPTSALFGRYESDVAAPKRLAGHWVLELDGNGTLAVTAPAGYAGVVSGTLFTADASTLRINLFAQDVCSNLGNGVFSWSRAGTRLVLAATDDRCPARREFFTGNNWTSVPTS